MKSSDATTRTDVAPSAARRKALRQSTTTKTTIVPTVPIKDYYSLTDRLYASFSVALDNRELDHAYVWGIRFATFSTEALPKHPSYNSATFAKLRQRNTQRTQQILTQLEAVTARMDAEERLKEQQRQRLVQQQQEEERERELERQKREQEEADEERKRLEIQQQYKEQEKIRLEKSKIARQQAVENSALAKLASLQQQPQKSASSDPPTSATTTTNGAGTNSSNDDVTSTAQAKLSALRASEQGSTTKREHQSKAASLQLDDGTSQQQRDDNITEVNNSDSFNPVKDLSTEEKQTLDLLQQTIARQEARIQDIVQVKIPAWRRQAKAKLAAGQRKEALHCVYHKRRWQQTVDFLKESIFQMETQILHIQSAAQDREVENVLQAAKDAMQAIHETTAGLGGEDSTSDAVENAMNEIGQGGLLPASLFGETLLEHENDDDVDVEELLHEILSEEESADAAATSVTSAKASDGTSSSMGFASLLPADVLNLLALPSAPPTESSKPSKEDAPEKTKSSGLLKAVLG